jgi:hypothetical protein
VFIQFLVLSLFFITALTYNLSNRAVATTPKAMSGVVTHCCHIAIISPFDNTASRVCHQIGRDYGDESFSGFEFRHKLHSDCELRCHLLHERCSEAADEWSDSVNRIAKLFTQFFDLNRNACPLIILATSMRHSNERLLSHFVVPMICKNFPGVSIIAIQSEASSSKPSECFQALPLVQCISFSDESIPVSVIPVLANLFYACSCSKQRTSISTGNNQTLYGHSFNSSPARVQHFSIPVSPVTSDEGAALSTVTGPNFSSSSLSSIRASKSPHLDEEGFNGSPPPSGCASNSMLGLSLKWNADGLTVQGVAEDSLAGRSGKFKYGDTIVHVDGIDVASSRVSRHEAIARLRQACNVPVQVCTRAGPGWQDSPSRPPGSLTLFHLISSPASSQNVTSCLQGTLPTAAGADAVEPNSDFARAKQLHFSGDSVAAAAHLLNAARRNHPPSCAMLASFYLNGCGGLPLNYQLAFALARWSSLQKDPDGMGILACCYLFGLGTNQDITLAHTLASGCSDASPHGQFGLGYMYLHGLGVVKDSAMAER